MDPIDPILTGSLLGLGTLDQRAEPGHVPHDLPRRLKEKGHKVGIVTSSIRSYAEQIAKQFGIVYDDLVAYYDTEAHKPDPEPINLAIQHLEADPAKTYYVGNDPIDFEAAYHAGVTSVGVGWCSPNWIAIGPNSPDIMIHRPSLLIEPPRQHRAYVGDREFADKAYEWHEGSLLQFNGLIRGFALGRYFATHDPRHAGSGLCTATLELKNADGPAERFGELLARALEETGVAEGFRYIVPVPLKPGQDRQRLEPILESMRKANRLAPEPVMDGLSCIRDYGSLKAKNPIERQEAVRGVFSTRYDWKKNRVIILDDVMTTGATTAECIATLKGGGARDFLVLALGKDQRTLERKECPRCGRIMKIRTNRQEGSKFWGCSGYPDQCRHTEDVE